MELDRIFLYGQLECSTWPEVRVSAKDVLLMLLATMKHGGQWDCLGKTFKIEWPTFEWTIVNFFRVIVDKMIDQNVTGRSSEDPISKIIQDHRRIQIDMQDKPRG